MPRHLDPADLPEPVARFARAEVAAGHYASVEDVLTAGVQALQERAAAEQEWLAFAQREAADGFAALDRGEGLSGTAGQHMSRIDLAVAARLGTHSVK
jgi:Arc/MetJ-type ribon-helix-helix transcriptional regulator